MLALSAGDPYRIARAFAMEAVARALEGADGQRLANTLTTSAEEIAQRIEHPHAMAWAASASAVTAWSEGRWRDCTQLADYASALFRERCADVFFELGSIEIWFNLPARYDRFAEIARIFGESPDGRSTIELAGRAVDALHRLCMDVGLTARLGSFGLDKGDLRELAQTALSHYPGHFAANPRPLSEGDAVAIYESVL